MADVRGQAEALTVLTPIIRGRERELAAALVSLPTGPESPLARLPGTHFGRWVIAPDLDPDASYLLFSTTFDVGPTDYIDEIRKRMPDEADSIWSHCDEYPGSRDPAAFKRYMERHRVRTSLFVAAYPNASLPTVLEAIDWRRRLTELAPRAQHLDAEALQAAFRDAFRSGRTETALGSPA
jgi:hypothetical protein